MFFRLKASGPRSYLQIVESRRDGARVQQHVIATIGRADELAANGGLAALLASGARFCEQVLLLSALDDDQRAPQLGLRRIGAPMAFGRLWDELGCPACSRRCWPAVASASPWSGRCSPPSCTA